MERYDEHIRVLIGDDEPLARDLLRSMLDEHAGIEVVAECGDGAGIVSAIVERSPDLVFLDIQMPELDGFDVLRELPGHSHPMVVFVTAHERHAIRAFEVAALDYVLKPFDEERIGRTVLRAREELRRRRAGDGVAGQMLSVLREIGARPKYLERVVIRDEGRLFFRAVGEIDWIEADGKYVKIHAENETHMIREGISRLEAELDPARFLRISRSAIVNIDRIRELRPWFQGDYLVVLDDGRQLASTRGFRDGIHALLGKRA